MAVNRGWKNWDTGKAWSKDERNCMAGHTKLIQEQGDIPHPRKLGCARCGQKEGIIHYHNHDYDHPWLHLEPLCWRCHLILHSWNRDQEACQRYWDEIAAGKQYPPVMQNDLGILRREHGIR